MRSVYVLIPFTLDGGGRWRIEIPAGTELIDVVDLGGTPHAVLTRASGDPSGAAP